MLVILRNEVLGLHVNFLSIPDFVIFGAVKAVIFLRMSMKLHPNFRHVSSDYENVQHRRYPKVLTDCEIHAFPGSGGLN